MATYALSDLHGDGIMFDAIMKKLKSDDRVFFLGDAIDRGPDGWRILKTMIADSRFTVLKGNHEDMMCRVLRYYPDWEWDSDFMHWLNNDSQLTIDAINVDTPENVNAVIKYFKNAPLKAEYVNANGEKFLLSHAGYDPWDEPEAEDLLWNRDHYFTSRWYGKNNEFIVYGHTPKDLLIKDLNQLRWYNEKLTVEPGSFIHCDGHKICIDCGTIWTGESVLLNLDTWDEEIFYIGKEDNKDV